MHDRSQDHALMQRVAAGENRAVTELRERFEPLIRRLAHPYPGAAANFDDVLQDVMLRLWRTAAKYDPERSALVTWVMLITRRELIDRRRAWMCRPNGFAVDAEWQHPEATDHHPQELLEREEATRGILGKIDRLKPNERAVVRLAYVRGMTLQQVGDHLGMPLGSVKTHSVRGRRELVYLSR